MFLVAVGDEIVQGSRNALLPYRRYVFRCNLSFGGRVVGMFPPREHSRPSNLDTHRTQHVDKRDLAFSQGARHYMDRDRGCKSVCVPLHTHMHRCWQLQCNAIRGKVKWEVDRSWYHWYHRCVCPSQLHVRPKTAPSCGRPFWCIMEGPLHHSSQKASPLGLCMMRVPIELASPGTTADGCRCHTILSAPAMVLFLLLSLLLYFSLVVAGWNWIVTS